MTRRMKNSIIIGINIFLVIALTISVFAVLRSQQDLNNAKSEIKHKQTAIEKQSEEKRELEEKLKQSEDGKAAIQSELDSTKQAKETLETENAQLKQTITELNAQKNGAGAVAVLPVPQNPLPTGKVCYLTFDDGPTDNTLRIIEILGRYNVKATFFVIDNAQSNIEYTKQLHDNGHAIGIHTSSHNYSYIYSSVDNYMADFNALATKVTQITGVESKLIRFPGGSSNGVSRKYCGGIMTQLAARFTEMGYTYFDWNVDSGDASGRLSASAITNNVLQAARNKNSICVLMHDAVGKSTTVDALPAIVEGLFNQGFYFAPLTPDCHGYHHSIIN